MLFLKNRLKILFQHKFLKNGLNSVLFSKGLPTNKLTHTPPRSTEGMRVGIGLNPSLGFRSVKAQRNSVTLIR